jgi:hypothetical protein
MHAAIGAAEVVEPIAMLPSPSKSQGTYRLPTALNIMLRPLFETFVILTFIVSQPTRGWATEENKKGHHRFLGNRSGI